MELSRDEHADILKGIGIVMMIAGHTGVLTLLRVDKYVRAFYMPMFFFVSGYFLKVEKYTMRQYIQKKKRQLLIPYVIWSLFHLALWLLSWRMGVPLEGEVRNVSIGVIWDNNQHFPIAGALWFISCLFIVSIVTFTLLYFFQLKVVGIFIFSIVLIGLYITPFIPFSGDSAMVAIGFFFLGFLFRHERGREYLIELKDAVSFMFFCIALMAYVVCVQINDFVNLRTCEYGVSPILYFATALIGIFIWWQISETLSKLKNNHIVLKKTVDLLSYCGRYSMPYLCLNQLIIAIMEKALSFRGGTVEQILITIVTLILCIIVNETCMRISSSWNIYKLLFGR